MKKNSKIMICKYNKCQKEFDSAEAKKLFSKSYSLSTKNFCSPLCYVKNVLENGVIYNH